MRTPLVTSAILAGIEQHHLDIDPQGNLRHTGGGCLCWCCPSCRFERNEAGKVIVIFIHRGLCFN
ncbi:MAG: hypothetical protein AABY75_05645 [Bacteroidota bacterium]